MLVHESFRGIPVGSTAKEVTATPGKPIPYKFSSREKVARHFLFDFVWEVITTARQSSSEGHVAQVAQNKTRCRKARRMVASRLDNVCSTSEVLPILIAYITMRTLLLKNFLKSEAKSRIHAG